VEWPAGTATDAAAEVGAQAVAATATAAAAGQACTAVAVEVATGAVAPSGGASGDEADDADDADDMASDADDMASDADDMASDAAGVASDADGVAALGVAGRGSAPNRCSTRTSDGERGRAPPHEADDRLPHVHPQLVPQPPARDVAPTAAGTTAEDGDEVGLLQMHLLKAYFVSHDPAHFTTLAAAVHTNGPSPLAPLRQVLAVPGVDINDGGACGWPPLSLALLGGDANLPAVELLLEARVDLEACPACRPGQTPLLLTAATRQEACTVALLRAGAGVNARGSDGKSALQLCAQWTPDAKACRACAMLLDWHADVSMRASDGRLAAYASALDAGNAATANFVRERMDAARTLAQQQLLGDESAGETGSPARAKSKGGPAQNAKGGSKKGAGTRRHS